MFYDNLQIACKNNGTSPTALVKKMEISTSNVTNWKKSPPVGDVVVRLSELLNVSCDFLLTGKENTGSLTADEESLLDFFRVLDSQRQKNLLCTARDAALACEIYKKSDTVSDKETAV